MKLRDILELADDIIGLHFQCDQCTSRGTDEIDEVRVLGEIEFRKAILLRTDCLLDLTRGCHRDSLVEVTFLVAPVIHHHGYPWILHHVCILPSRPGGRKKKMFQILCGHKRNQAPVGLSVTVCSQYCERLRREEISKALC